MPFKTQGSVARDGRKDQRLLPTAGASAIWRLRPDLRISAFDGEGTSGKYLVCGGGRRYLVDGTTAQALQLLQTLPDEAALEEGLRAIYGSQARAQEVFRKLRQKLPDALLDSHAPAATDHGRTFWWSATLLSQTLTQKLATPLSVMHRPAVAATLLVACGTSLYLAMRQIAAGFSLELSAVDAAAFYFGMFASGILHELGHASASIRHGAGCGPIGVGFYFVFPVLFSDVDATWSLRKAQRLSVDAAGFYFQLVTIAPLALIATVWSSELAARFIILTIFSIVSNLNPLLRLDGYWVLSDLLGIANLRTRAFRWWAQLPRDGLARSIRKQYWAGLAAYGAASMLFMTVFLWVVTRAALASFVVIASAFGDRPMPWTRLAGALVVAGFICSGIVRNLRVLARRLGLGGVRPLSSQHSRGSPS